MSAPQHCPATLKLHDDREFVAAWCDGPKGHPGSHHGRFTAENNEGRAWTHRIDWFD